MAKPPPDVPSPYWSPSVNRAATAFASDPEHIIPAWLIVQELCRIHPEYGERRAEELAKRSFGPMANGLMGDTFEGWMGRVRALVGADKAPMLHGRLVILALCRIDSGLRELIDTDGFVTALEKEWTGEPFDSLLAAGSRSGSSTKASQSSAAESTGAEEWVEDEPDAAEAAGDTTDDSADAPPPDEDYKEQFLRILQNRAKQDAELGKARTTGFLILVRGGPSLRPLIDACFDQGYNSVLAAHYRLAGTQGINDAFDLLFPRDVVRFWAGLPTVGMRPIPTADDPGPWKDFLGDPPADLPPAADEAFILNLDSKQLNDLLKSTLPEDLHGRLRTGQRLVVFVETNQSRWSGASPRAGTAAEKVLEDLDIDPEGWDAPERTGLVISGIPDDFELPEPHAAIETLTLPAEAVPDQHGQPFSNDLPQGDDQLQIAAEVHAIAETIALKKMKPPLVVGVLGGWGWGKSFVLHLLEERLRDIRCAPLRTATDDEAAADSDGFPYIGHPYVIRFDAWTYAKADLWASLMQTILLELDRQIGLEQQLIEAGLSAEGSHSVWRALADSTDKQRQQLKEMLDEDERLPQTGRFSEDVRKKLTALEKGELGKVTSESLWDVLSDLRHGEREDLRKAEEELAETQSALQEARTGLEREVDERLDEQARWSVWEMLRPDVAAFLETSAAAAAPSVDGAPSPPNFGQIHSNLKWFWQLDVAGYSTAVTGFLAFGAASLLIAAAQGATAQGASLGDSAVAWLSPVIGAAGSVGAVLQKSRTWLEDRRSAWETGLQASRERLQQQRAQLLEQAMARQAQDLADERAREARAISRADEAGADEAGADEAGAGAAPSAAEPDEQTTNVVALEEHAQLLEAKVEGHRRNVGITAAHGSLLDFVKGRIESGFYDERLGLLHQVQRDLEELTDALVPNPNGDGQALSTLFPRGEPRVVLVIDDLDRCPPERVVEVLEAAQLLVKTPLFVLVIAVDLRFVTRALEKQYSQVLERDGEPSGLDYIEKIIQVPYPAADSKGGNGRLSRQPDGHRGPGVESGGSGARSSAGGKARHRGIRPAARRPGHHSRTDGRRHDPARDHRGARTGRGGRGAGQRRAAEPASQVRPRRRRAAHRMLQRGRHQPASREACDQRLQADEDHLAATRSRPAPRGHPLPGDAVGDVGALPGGHALSAARPGVLLARRRASRADSRVSARQGPGQPRRRSPARLPDGVLRCPRARRQPPRRMAACQRAAGRRLLPRQCDARHADARECPPRELILVRRRSDVAARRRRLTDDRFLDDGAAGSHGAAQRRGPSRRALSHGWRPLQPASRHSRHWFRIARGAHCRVLLAGHSVRFLGS